MLNYVLPQKICGFNIMVIGVSGTSFRDTLFPPYARYSVIIFSFISALFFFYKTTQQKTILSIIFFVILAILFVILGIYLIVDEIIYRKKFKKNDFYN